MTSDIKVVVDSSDLQLLSRDLADIPKKAKDSASVFEREFNKVERRLNKTATASQSYYSEILKIDQQSKSAAASAAVFESALKRDEIATKRLATEKERLASKYKPLYAASKQYEIALEEINRAQKLGVLNDQQRSTSISQLNRDFQQGTGIFSTHANMMNKGMNKLGVATQQAGYQVGDFIVQVQSGTNPMVAFSQQMTQMVGVLYLLPPATLNAKIGFMGLKLSMSFLIAGLGIAIPLLGALGAAFLRSKQGAEQTEKPIDDLADAMKTLKDETERAKEQLDLLNSGLKTTAELRVRNEILRLESGIAKVEAEILALQEKGGAQATRQLRNVYRPRLTALNNELVIQQDLLEGYQEGQRLLTAETDQLNQQMIARQNLALTVAQVNSNNARDTQTYHNQFLAQNAAAMAALKQKTDQEKADTLEIILLRQKMVGIGFASGRGGDPRQQGTRYQQEFGYKTIDELIAEFKSKNKINKSTQKAIDLTRELTDVQKQQVEIADTVSGAFGDMFMNMIDGTMSAKDAFRAMAADIIRELYRIMVVEQMVQSIKGAILGGFAPAPSQGRSYAPPVAPRGNSIFDGGGYTGSGPRSGGLDGKGGFMAMLHPRETVVDHTKGQSVGGDTVTVNQTINVSTGVQQTVRAEIKQLMPQIADSAKAAVVDAKRRGGSYGRAFS